MNKIRISGVGCCLIDRIYDNVDFQSDAFRKYWSKKAGDGGLEPGKLTFEEELESFAGESFASGILPLPTAGRPPQKENVGGPCVVALINAAQLAYRESEVCFYGCRGDDGVGEGLMQKLRQTDLDLSHYRIQEGSETASTSVLSDPHYDNGHGERTFVNTIGASWHYLPGEVDDSFYESDICVFGGTALVPRIHQGLSAMLRRAKEKGSITVVNTVYDFLNEKEHPDKRWPMGDGDESYPYIDLLIVDREEALRLSGEGDIPSAIAFFREKGAGAVLVTNGSHNVSLWANSPLFGKVEEQTLPVSAAVGEALKRGKKQGSTAEGEVKGDSTGCGDNFAGGVIGSLARQFYNEKMKNERDEADSTAAANSSLFILHSSFDLIEACRWGIVSGGFACFYYGGTYLEQHEGEKLAHLKELYDKYLLQT